MPWRRPRSPLYATVVSASSADLPEIACLDTDIHRSAARTWEQWERHAADDLTAIYAATKWGAVVGFALAEVRCNAIHLQALAVASRLRRRGVATQLIQTIVHEADSCPLTATIHERNVVGQIFLRSLGFRWRRTLERKFGADDGYKFSRMPTPKAVKQPAYLVP